MIHLVLHLNDPQILLRLSGLIACSAAIVCLGLIELKPRVLRWVHIAATLLVVILTMYVGYLVTRLKGA